MVDYLDRVEKMGKPIKMLCAELLDSLVLGFEVCSPINPCCVHNCFDPAEPA